MCSSTPAPPPPPTSPRCSKPRTDCRRVWGRCEDRETSGCYRPPTLGERSRIPPAPRHVGPELLGHALLSKSSRGGSGSPSSGSSVPTVRDERAFWAHQVHAHLLNTIGAAILQSQVCEAAVRGALPSSVDEVLRLRDILRALEETTRVMATAAVLPRDLLREVRARTEAFAASHPELTLRLSTRGRGRVGRRTAAAVVIVLTEALANAVRHGPPASIEVDLAVGGGSVLLRVRD